MQWIRKHISRSEDQDKQDPTPPPAAAESGQQMESSQAQNLENPSSNSQEPPASQYSSKDPKLPKGSQNPEMVKATGPPLQQSIEEENPEKKKPSQDDEDLASVGRQENKEEVGSDGVLEDKDEEEEQDKAGAVVAAVEEEDDQGEEECLVSIPGTVVHLVDDEESPHLATGVFSIVRITQKGNGILVLANVGHNLHWPVLKDMPTVKLDPTHYFFSLPLTPVMMDDDDDDEAPHPNGDNNQNENESSGKDVKVLTYGVTFPLQGSDTALPVLDSLLEHYSHFSSPTVVHEDKEKDEWMEKNPEEGLHIASRSMNIPTDGKPNDYNGMVIPPQQVTRRGKKMDITERNQADFWTTMAPNVDDYGSSAARAIATGSGQVVKGIFWVRDSTVTKLDNGSIYMQSKLKENNKPHNVSPGVLRNLHRVRRMSRATENVAKGVLTGVIVTTGFFEGAIIKSKAGKKIFKLMPGEVALVSLDAFGKLFDAVEKTSRDILQSTSIMTQNVVGHRFGDSAAKVAEETLATAGHVVATAWTVTKLRKALNPKASPAGASKLTKTGLLKAAAKNTLKGAKKVDRPASKHPRTQRRSNPHTLFSASEAQRIFVTLQLALTTLLKSL